MDPPPINCLTKLFPVVLSYRASAEIGAAGQKEQQCARSTSTSHHAICASSFLFGQSEPDLLVLSIIVHHCEGPPFRHPTTQGLVLPADTSIRIRLFPIFTTPVQSSPVSVLSSSPISASLHSTGQHVGRSPHHHFSQHQRAHHQPQRRHGSRGRPPPQDFDGSFPDLEQDLTRR